MHFPSKDDGGIVERRILGRGVADADVGGVVRKKKKIDRRVVRRLCIVISFMFGMDGLIDGES